MVRLCSSAGFLVLACLALVQPCSAGKVKAQTQPGVNLSQYKTYQWWPSKMLGKMGVVEDDPVIAPLVKEAVNRELGLRGLKEVAQGGDLQVSTLVLSESVPQLEQVFLQGNIRMTYGTPIASIGRYNRQGSLFVALIDSQTNNAAWFGMVTESLDDKPGAGQKKISKATEDLFKKFPVKKQRQK